MLNWIADISGIAAFLLLIALVWYSIGRLAKHLGISRLMAVCFIFCFGWLLS
jgi:apolipoprotein N-acyltransferase